MNSSPYSVRNNSNLKAFSAPEKKHTQKKKTTTKNKKKKQKKKKNYTMLTDICSLI